MSASVNGRPAGTPSMTAVSASPWDSPAVRKRKISAIDEALVARRSEYHAARGRCRPPKCRTGSSLPRCGTGRGGRRTRCRRRGDRLQNGRRQENDQLPTCLEVLLLLEEVTEDRDVAEHRDLPDGVLVGAGRHPADDQAVTLANQNLGLRLPAVDGRRRAGVSEVHGVTARVVF